MLQTARMPAILADVQLIQYHAQSAFCELLAKSGFPYATPMLGKCVLDEDHPQFIGLYAGRNSRDYVRRRVEEADVILQLGVLMTDFNTGICSKESACGCLIAPRRRIYCQV